jgi:hypothetical protein
MSKVTQYVVDDTKVCVRFSKVNLKEVQSLLQKTLLEKNEKGRQKWKEPCIIVRLLANMLRIPIKIQFVSHVILFQETLEYYNVISICYGWQQPPLNLSFRVSIF